MAISQKLGRDQRLKSRKLITSLFREGKQITAFPLRAIYMPTETAVTLQAGFAVSSKNFKKAVDRNRLKRLMREAYRLQKNELNELLKTNNRNLIIFFIYTGKQKETFETVNKKMTALLISAIKNLGLAVNPG